MPRSGPAVVTGVPFNRISPASGSSSPAMAQMSVVLPLPENPTMATNSPLSIEKFTSCSTSVRALPSPYALQSPLISRNGMTRRPSAPRAEAEQALQPVHDPIEQEADEADGEHGHEDSRERIGAAVLEFVPDEFPEAGVLREHLRGDQHHPAHAEREPQAREDERQRRGEHQLEEPCAEPELQHARDVHQVLVDG